MYGPPKPHGLYSPGALSAGVLNNRPGWLPGQQARGALTMLDLIFVATGAAFLYLCVLYAFACDRL